MRSEPVQRGNPHGLRVRQHAFPARSIERFCRSGRVAVRLLKKGGKILAVDPRHQLFCKDRLWDEWSETGFMQKIENDFQPIAEAIVNGLSTIATEQHE